MIGSLRTRLVDRALWYRHCGWFTFAHKPLCSHYSAGVLRMGGLAVCRSCTLVYAAAAIVALSGIWAPGLFMHPLAPFLLIGLTFATVAVSYPPFYKRLPRPVCDLARSSLGAVIAATAVILILDRGEAVAWVNAGLLLAIWFVYGTLRQKHKRGKCATCPEFKEGHICSGFREQAEGVRRYQDEMADYLTSERMKRL